MAWARIVVVVYQIVTRSSSFEVYGLADRLRSTEMVGASPSFLIAYRERNNNERNEIRGNFFPLPPSLSLSPTKRREREEEEFEEFRNLAEILRGLVRV